MFIVSIVYQPEGQDYPAADASAGGHAFYGDYLRVPVAEATLVADHGIQGDQKAGHNPLRQLNLLSQEWLKAIAPQGYRTAPGQFGEQLVVSGVDFAGLKPGDRLQLGPEAVIEITKPRTGCERLEAAQGQAIAPLAGTGIGLLARVVTGGRIRVGDEVRRAGE